MHTADFHEDQGLTDDNRYDVRQSRCTGSDGVAEIDEETLQQLFEDNIQDFMNNTTVTVIQRSTTTITQRLTILTTLSQQNSVINEQGHWFGISITDVVRGMGLV